MSTVQSTIQRKFYWTGYFVPSGTELMIWALQIYFRLEKFSVLNRKKQTNKKNPTFFFCTNVNRTNAEELWTFYKLFIYKTSPWGTLITKPGGWFISHLYAGLCMVGRAVSLGVWSAGHECLRTKGTGWDGTVPPNKPKRNFSYGRPDSGSKHTGFFPLLVFG